MTATPSANNGGAAATLPATTASFLAGSGIPHVLPSSPDFAAHHGTFVEPVPGAGHVPAAVAKPRTVADVEALVAHCAVSGTPFSVRGGGHDMFRRAVVPGALLVDVRALDSVEISPDRASAVVGGGVLQGTLLDRLEEHGLTTATGTVASVGYIGWSTLGGYGPGSTLFGLGVDQILGARIVGPDGMVIVADGEMLRALRGAGGSLGVIVELTVKVYPMQQIQCGTLVYESGDIATSFSSFLTNLDNILSREGLPENLYIMPSAYSLPQGMAVICGFVWRGASREDPAFLDWVSRIAGLGQCVFPDPVAVIRTATPRGFVADVTALMPSSAHGGADSVNLRRFSPDTVPILGRAVADFPLAEGRFGGVNVHTLASLSPSAGSREELRKSSVFRCREPHFMLEFLAMGVDAELGAEALRWANRWVPMLRVTDAALEESYISVTDPKASGIEKFYDSETLAWLRELKAQVDPDSVFVNTVPKLV